MAEPTQLTDASSQNNKILIFSAMKTSCFTQNPSLTDFKYSLHNTIGHTQQHSQLATVQTFSSVTLNKNNTQANAAKVGGEKLFCPQHNFLSQDPELMSVCL
jgi:hypothetical protein